MEIIFLGTSSGKVSLSRFFSSILLRCDNNNLLVDTGDGISKQLLNSGIGFSEIDGILFSHYHADHFGGIASLITQMKLFGRTKKLTVFTHQSLENNFLSCLNTSYIFLEKLGFELELVGFGWNKSINVAKGVSFIGKQNSHLVNNAEIVTDVPFVSSSFLFELNGTKILYSSDIGSVADLYLFENWKCNIIISEARHISYCELNEAFSRLQPEHIYITHYDDESLEELKNNFSRPEIIIAYDGLKINLDK